LTYTLSLHDALPISPTTFATTALRRSTTKAPVIAPEESAPTTFTTTALRRTAPATVAPVATVPPVAPVAPEESVPVTQAAPAIEPLKKAPVTFTTSVLRRSEKPRVKFDLLDIISNNADCGEYIYLENQLN
jgi:hypothetical protein